PSLQLPEISASNFPLYRASLPCRSNAAWLNATRTFFTRAGSILWRSMRSNMALFMPWIDEADGHRRNAICSSSQRFPRSAVTAAGRPPFALALYRPPSSAGRKLPLPPQVFSAYQRRDQARNAAAALVDLPRRRSPRCEGAGGLAAGEAERPGHGFGVEPAKSADRRSGTERTQHAGAVPTLGAERGIIEADPDPRRHLASGGDGDEEVAARQPVALGNRQGGRHHFRRHMGQRRAVHVAHGDRGNE